MRHLSTIIILGILIICLYFLFDLVRGACINLSHSSCLALFSQKISNLTFSEKLMYALAIIAIAIPLFIYILSRIKSKEHIGVENDSEVDHDDYSCKEFFSDIKSKKAFVEKATNLAMTEGLFLIWTSYFIENSKQIFILNWDMKYWTEWKRCIDRNQNRLNDGWVQHCRDVISNVKNRSHNVGFDANLIRIFIIEDNKFFEYIDLFREITEAHDRAYAVSNKVLLSKNGIGNNFGITNNIFFSHLIRATHEETGVNFFIAKFHKISEPENPLYELYVEGSEEYNKIIKCAKPYFSDSYDLRTFYYKEILDMLISAGTSKKEVANRQKFNKIKSILNDTYLLKHDTMKTIQEILR